ncbi:MAG: NUDIX hydrolase [Pseudomonadota bacterium]|nr:NUDIX hydrolase [Pseudomonadota bacterium]
MTREYPEYPMVGVGVVVWKGETVLIIQRGKPPRVGTWSLPGGRQELGETTREAGVREVLEETGLCIKIKGLIDVVDSISRDGDGRVRMQYTLVDYWAEWISGDPVASTDADDARWVHPDELPTYKLWDETLRVIDISAKAR